MGQGSRLLGPFGMPEGGRVAVKGIGRRAIFPDQFLAIDRHNPHLLLGNRGTSWFLVFKIKDRIPSKRWRKRFAAATDCHRSGDGCGTSRRIEPFVTVCG